MSGRANFEPTKKRSRPKAAQVDSRRTDFTSAKPPAQCRKTGGFASSPQTMRIARPIVGAVGLEGKNRETGKSPRFDYASIRPRAVAFDSLFEGGGPLCGGGSAELPSALQPCPCWTYGGPWFMFH